MSSVRRPLLAALAAVLLLGALVPPASAETRVGEIQQSPASVGFDMVILRPVGLIATGVGAVFAVPATLFTAITRPTEIAKPVQFFVMRPARYTFADPIGSH